MTPTTVRHHASSSLPSRLVSFAVRVLGLTALAAALWFGLRLLPRKQFGVHVIRATAGTVRDVVSSSSAGEISPELHATLRAEIAGRVVAIYSARGQRVKKGQRLVLIDPADLDARVRQSAAAVDEATAQRVQSVARLQTLKRQAERAQVLAQGGAGPIQASEDAQAAVAEAEGAVQLAEGTKARQQAALQVAQVQRSRAEVVAPFDGLITEFAATVGDSLTPGVTVVEIIGDDRLHVDATVDEADAARVKLDQPAELHLDALPGRNFAGRVTRVDPVVKRDLKGARTLTVEVEVEGVEAARAAGLKPGMSANVEIIVAAKDNVLSIPSNIIVGRGVSRFVYLVEPEGQGYRVRRRVVEVGLSNWERSEIKSGLNLDAMVVTSLNEKGLDDGVSVQPVELPRATP